MAAKYKVIRKHGHPNAFPDGKVYEHIFVMSEILGRPLTELEVVHHIDENKQNNHPDNLQLFATDEEHHTHHKHLRAMQACGNPAYKRCSYCKWYDDASNMTAHAKNGSYYHKECAQLFQSALKEKQQGLL